MFRVPLPYLHRNRSLELLILLNRNSTIVALPTPRHNGNQMVHNQGVVAIKLHRNRIIPQIPNVQAKRWIPDFKLATDIFACTKPNGHTNLLRTETAPHTPKPNLKHSPEAVHSSSLSGDSKKDEDIKSS